MFRFYIAHVSVIKINIFDPESVTIFATLWHQHTYAEVKPPGQKPAKVFWTNSAISVLSQNINFPKMAEVFRLVLTDNVGVLGPAEVLRPGHDRLVLQPVRAVD